MTTYHGSPISRIDTTGPECLQTFYLSDIGRHVRVNRGEPSPIKHPSEDQVVFYGTFYPIVEWIGGKELRPGATAILRMKTLKKKEVSRPEDHFSDE